MTCEDCAEQADRGLPGEFHPQDCGCTCQHRNPGAWKGGNEDDD